MASSGRPVSRHRYPRGQRGPGWSTALAVAGICLFVAGGSAVAVKHPIASPSSASLEVGTTDTTSAPLDTHAGATGSATSSTAATSASPSISATDPSTSTAAPRPGEPTFLAGNVSATTGSAAAPAPAVALGPPGAPCRPARFSLAPLGIDTTVVTLTLTPEGDLGTPSAAARGSAGWFPSVLAGASRGTVLMDGHTYHDGSAIFQTTFKQQVRTGMTMRLSCADGRTFSYRISEVVLDLTPTTYPQFVTGRNLYSADGPPQLVMVTCTDYIPAQRVWANRAVVIATPLG